MSSRYLVKRKYKNLSRYQLYKKEISGHDTSPMFMVPTDGLGHMSHGEVLKALRVLEAALQRFENQRHTIMTQLKVLESNLTTGPDEYLGDSVGLLEIISLINKHSGVKTLLSLLMVPDLGTGCCDLDKCDHSATVGNLQATTLTILNMLTTLNLCFEMGGIEVYKLQNPE
ncbi:uncharacterized protein [Penaeus vannamei]|uniref:uncharacterized protein n=1 Tax=Penaeus vannamei TaxID=6689 RepID=UPI00387F4251